MAMRIHASPGRRRPWAAVLIAAGLQALACALWAQDSRAPGAGPLPAAAVDAIPVTLDPDARQKLMAVGSVSSYFQAQAKVELCPSPAAAAEIARSLEALHPNIGVQTLVVAAMPEHLAAKADRDLRLYNLLHQFRTMEGMPYFSASHGRMMVFFTVSHVIKGPGDRAILEDPHYPAIEPSHSLYLEQEDSTFGRNLYAATVRAFEGGAVELAMSNTGKVRYGILSVLGPGALKLALVIQPSADGRFLYFYGNVGILASRWPGVETTVRRSFQNRILAFYTWYAKLAGGE